MIFNLNVIIPVYGWYSSSQVYRYGTKRKECKWKRYELFPLGLNVISGKISKLSFLDEKNLNALIAYDAYDDG